MIIIAVAHFPDAIYFLSVVESAHFWEYILNLSAWAHFGEWEKNNGKERASLPVKVNTGLQANRQQQITGAQQSHHYNRTL